MFYFDADVQLGRFGRKHRRTPWNKEQLLAAMDRCGISAALVYSGTAAVDSPKLGNAELYETIREDHRLYGCYTVIPNLVGDFYEPAEMIRDMQEKGMVAARIFPATYGFSTCEAVLGEYLQVLETAGFPLFIHTEEISEEALEELVRNHPRLSVVWQHRNWTDERKTLPLVRRYPNLFIDLSRNQANCAVEYYPTEKLIFGSHWPLKSMGAARSFVDYARIPEKEKQAIAGGNLCCLCGVQPEETVPVFQDTVARQAAAGQPLEVLVFDSHTHVMEPGGNCGAGYLMYHGDQAHMDPLFAAMGVDAYVVAPWHGIWADTEAGNRAMLEMTAKEGVPKAYGYVMIDPNYTDDVGAAADYYHNKLKIPGMKMFYNRTGVRYNDPVYDPWWEIADRNHLFALLDYGGYPGYLTDVADIARRYPNVKLFLDHTGRSFEAAQGDIPYARQYPNIYLQITYTSVVEGMMEYFCAEGVADRVLYGTDAPMRDPRPQLGWVAFADIPEEDKRKILGENMQKILNECFH